MTKAIRNKFKEIFNESMGGITGFHPGVNATPKLQQLKDRKRKKIERQGGQRQNKLKESKKTKDDVPPDPRLNLSGELRFNVLESFINNVIGYLDTNKSRYMMEAFSLLEEYPKLKEYVKEKSLEGLPKNSFSVFSARERFNEEKGQPGYRTGDNPHNWSLTKHQARQNAALVEKAIIIEAKISPDKVILYVPAFTKLMEKLILSGKIEEPKTNVIRKAKLQNEVILPQSINTGLIIETEE